MLLAWLNAYFLTSLSHGFCRLFTVAEEKHICSKIREFLFLLLYFEVWTLHKLQMSVLSWLVKEFVLLLFKNINLHNLFLIILKAVVWIFAQKMWKNVKLVLGFFGWYLLIVFLKYRMPLTNYVTMSLITITSLVLIISLEIRWFLWLRWVRSPRMSFTCCFEVYVSPSNRLYLYSCLCDFIFLFEFRSC